MSTDSLLLPPIRDLFLATGDAALILMSAQQVGANWDSPSVCNELSIGALAYHLSRAITQVEVYLNEPTQEGRGISAGDYYAGISGLSDSQSAVNIGVRSKSSAGSEDGQSKVVEDAGSCLDRLRITLQSEPADRVVGVFGGSVMQLDQYLLTRIVELTVHMDDLAESAIISLPDIPPEAYVIAIGTLVQTASVRHGSKAVLRALARPDRTDSKVLEVF